MICLFRARMDKIVPNEIEDILVVSRFFVDCELSETSQREFETTRHVMNYINERAFLSPRNWTSMSREGVYTVSTRDLVLKLVFYYVDIANGYSVTQSGPHGHSPFSHKAECD